MGTSEAEHRGRQRPVAAASPFTTRLERGKSSAPAESASRIPAWAVRLLRIPLPGKLIGANTLLFAAAIAVTYIARDHGAGAIPVITIAGSALLIALAVNFLLVSLAVRPIHVLERTVDRMWRGDLDARVPDSLLADRHLARVGRMFNILLDGLIADRAHTRRLATEIVHAGERERDAISRELHDSTAQSLAGLVMQLSALSSAADRLTPDRLREQLDAAKLVATGVLEEVRLLAHTTYPRVLDDLGLVAALRRLARETSEHTSIPVDVTADASAEEIRGDIASVLYRVAQEAVRNAIRHSLPSRVDVRLGVNPRTITLEVADDGHGFDAERAVREHAGMGLFTMRERVTLVDGVLEVHSRPGGGTSVVASVPRVQCTASLNEVQR
jgi:signal transduction histidine kinase